MRREPPDDKTRREIREFFGIDKLERKPIACNSFKFMVRVFSLMPDQENNPFAKYVNDPEYNSGIEGEAYNSTRSESHGVMVHGKTKTQHAIEILMSPSTKEGKECRPNSSERLRYTREQLLHLKTAFVPEHVKKDVQEIGAEIHRKIEDQHIAAAFKTVIPEILKSKKRGSSSGGKKEKKKAQRRIKRAKFNREHGVPRLKLPLIDKPKVVQHCRHYLNGRCYEGEKCKFSHDVVPLTKSMPCCHFARQSCMKGDGCPFDHQLSKYPCNSFADTGFCSRGESCLFSHKISVKKGSEPSVMALNCDTSSMDQNNISKSKQQIEASLPITSRKATPNMVLETLATKARPPANKPKGLSFVSFGGSQSDNSIQPKEPDLVATLTNIQGSGTQQGINYPVFEITSTDTSRENKQPSIPPRVQSSLSEFPTKIDLPVKNPKSNSRSEYAVGRQTPNHAFNFSEIFKDKAPNVSEMFKGSPNQASAPGKSVSSSDGSSYDISSGKSASVFSTKGDTNTQTCLREKVNINLSEKSKKVQPEQGLRGSQTSSSQYSTKGAQSDSQSQNKAFNFSDVFKGFPTPRTDWAVNGSDMFKGALTLANAQGNSLSSSDGQSFGIPGGKSASIFPTKRDTDFQFVFGEKGNKNVSEKSKEVLPAPRLWGSQTTLSQNSTKVDLPVKNVPSNSQRALQAALAFAAKYQSGIKRSSDSGSRPSEPLQGS